MLRGESITPRLLARRPGPADEPLYRRLLLDPEVRQWLRPPPLAAFATDDPAALLERDCDHWERYRFGPWVLLDRADSSFVGRGGLVWSTSGGFMAVELPWAIVPERWNEGLATEAAVAAIDTAQRLGLDEVVALTLPANVPSRRVMEKAGLRLREEIEHAGLPHLLYGLRLDD